MIKKTTLIISSEYNVNNQKTIYNMENITIQNFKKDVDDICRKNFGYFGEIVEKNINNIIEATIKYVDDREKITIKIPLNFMNTAITTDNFFIADTNDSSNWDTLKIPLPIGEWSIYSHSVKNGEVVLVKNINK